MSQNTYDKVFERIIKEGNLSHTKREQGTLFERVIKKILQVEPRFKNEYKEVYLWNEFNAKFGIDSGDMGIDLMAFTHDEKWVSIQCKCFDTQKELYQGDLKNFLGINNITKSSGEIFADISQKLIFHTCKKVSDNVSKSLEQAKTMQSQAKIYGYYDLEGFDIDWESFVLEDLDTVKAHKPKELRDYQKEALQAITQSIANGEKRAKIIMACGTGKSLLSIRTIDTILAKDFLSNLPQNHSQDFLQNPPNENLIREREQPSTVG